jgi:hypothetical protein
MQIVATIGHPLNYPPICMLDVPALPVAGADLYDLNVNRSLPPSTRRR